MKDDKKKQTSGKGGKKINIGYLIGIIGAIAVCMLGMVSKVQLEPKFEITINFKWLIRFFDPASVFITIGCTVFVVIASFPGSMVGQMGKHLGIITHTNAYDPLYYIDQLVELAQVARKEGLLSLEERARQQSDPFFRQAVMLVVDAYDADKVTEILETDIENMSSRHDAIAGMYDRASSVAPAFGMVGTLVGLINMLKGMDLSAGGQSSIGNDMGTALITTLYGCILAHMVFGPIATQLRNRDEEEVLCKMIIVEGVKSIQAGENPKFVRERLMTFMAQQQRDENGGKKGKKGKKAKAATTGDQE